MGWAGCSSPLLGERGWEGEGIHEGWLFRHNCCKNLSHEPPDFSSRSLFRRCNTAHLKITHFAHISDVFHPLNVLTSCIHQSKILENRQYRKKESKTFIVCCLLYQNSSGCVLAHMPFTAELFGLFLYLKVEGFSSPFRSRIV